jgi:hypothetical protein
MLCTLSNLVPWFGMIHCLCAFLNFEFLDIQKEATHRHGMRRPKVSAPSHPRSKIDQIKRGIQIGLGNLASLGGGERLDNGKHRPRTSAGVVSLQRPQ